MPPARYLKPREVADQLGVTLRFVYGLLASGELPSVKLSPRARRIKREDFESFLAARRQGGEAA